MDNIEPLLDSVIASLSESPYWSGLDDTDQMFSDLQKLGDTWVQIGKERQLDGPQGEKLNKLLNLLASRIYDVLRYRKAIQQFNSFNSTVVQ